MGRMFETHDVRFTKSLDGLWNFKMEGNEKAYKMPVPGCWEQHPDFVKHKGTGTYTKRIFVKETKNLRLEFKGVSHTADVYFDGEKVCHHYNAYTPFSCIIKNVSRGEHEIKVEVNNEYNEKSALHIPNDYYTYGGIIRPSLMEYVPDVYIKYVHFTPSFDGAWNGKTEVCIENISDTDKSVDVAICLSDVSELKRCEVKANSKLVCVFENTYENVLSWDNENPNLYYLTAKISDDGTEDDFIERVAFRTVNFDNSNLLLNGKPVFLKGVNRHEDYGIVGSAIPLQLMVNDLDLIADIGANAIRTCHYPNDERFLDLCDERGFLVWEENHARGFEIEDMQNPNFEKQCEDCINEMIENHYNHPSIVVWGILNECASHVEEGRKMYAKQFEQIKSLDKTRPVSFASNKWYEDISLDLPDIVSYNLYNGWYTFGDTKEELYKLLDWVNENGGKNKPVIISEFGAGAVYGYRDRTRVKWSEEGQADLLEDNISVYLNDERLTGIFIWMFSDCRVDEEKWALKRPKTQNNKGIVDIYRRQKLSYDTVKELFTKK